MMRFISVFSLCVLALLSVSADGAPFPLDPTIDLPLKPQFYEHQFAEPQSPNAYDERVLSPVADAFVASSYPFDWKEFGKEEFVALGKHGALGNLETYVTYSWSLPDNFLYVSEAKLLFGAGGGSEETVRVEIQRTEGFDEETINDQTKPRVISAAGSGEIGELGFWYAFDVTESVYDAVDGPWWGNAISFGMYADTSGYKFYKLSSSRESDPAMAPQLYIQHLVDYEAPMMEFEPTSEWAQKGVDQVILHIVDPPAPHLWRTRVRTEVDREATQDNWKRIYSSSVPGEWTVEVTVGETSPSGITRYRARGQDRFENSSDFVYTDPIKVYTTDLTGWITDHRYHRLPAVDPNLSPDPWYIIYNPERKSFTARLRTGFEFIDPQVTGYGSWGPTSVSVYDPEKKEIIAPIPPIDNVMKEVGAADNIRLWEVIGSGDIRLITHYGVNKPSIQFTAEDTSTSYICPTSTYELAEMNQPTQALYYKTNVDLWLTWQYKDGSFERIQEIMHSNNWIYAWGDFSALRPYPGRPCFEFNPGAVQNAFMMFDSISLGSTRSDFELTIRPPAQLPPPSEPYPIDLVVTNHSPYPATGILHLTVEGESEPRSWLLPELAPDEIFTRSVLLVSPAEDDTLWMRATVGKPEIDDTPWRNTAQWVAFHNATLIYQPLVMDQ